MKSLMPPFFLFLLISNNLFAQNTTGKIEGYIYENGRKDPTIGAVVKIYETEAGSITDVYGHFEIGTIAPGIYSITISYLGYEKMELSDIKVISGETTQLPQITLKESPLSLKEVVITPGQYAIMGNTPLSKQTLGGEDLKNMSFAEDITRAVSRLPGVASTDFSSKFTVRGGEADEVLMTIDGMELYEPFHQRDFSGGLFSIVDIEVVDHVNLITGGFSSEFGQRQSGVFEMSSKTPMDDETKTSLGLSVMNARFFRSGNLANNRLKYFVSARRGMLDQTFKLIGETENTPKFYDTMGKLEFRLNDNHIISAHVLHSGDQTAIRDISDEAHDIHDTQYSNTYGWMTWKASFRSNVFARTLLYSGFISHQRNGDTSKDEYSDKLYFQLDDKRSYGFVGIKQDWNFDIGENFILKTGFDLRHLSADYDYQLDLRDIRVTQDDSLYYYSNKIDIQTKPSGLLTSGYISAKFKLVKNTFMEAGLRHDYASYSGDNLWSPRISMTYSFSKKTFLRAAWGQYYQSQFMNNLDVNHDNATFNKAELSEHYVLGLQHIFPNGLNFRLEGYYKDISRLSPNFQNLRDPWEVFPESRNDIVKLDFDGASAKGIELFLKYDIGKNISCWFSYALADASENIKTIEYDALLTPKTGVLPRYNNQKHTIYTDINYRPAPKWSFNLSWQYYIGTPMTIYTYEIQDATRFTETELPLHFYPRHLEFRGKTYPAYHRMDLRMNRGFDVKNGQIKAFIHLVNIYNKENLRKFDLDARDDNDNLNIDENGNYVPFRDDKTWFGFLPVIGMSWEF